LALTEYERELWEALRTRLHASGLFADGITPQATSAPLTVHLMSRLA
jgi:murein L,D-transpeptidase YcbB/YkuD